MPVVDNLLDGSNGWSTPCDRGIRRFISTRFAPCDRGTAGLCRGGGLRKDVAFDAAVGCQRVENLCHLPAYTSIRCHQVLVLNWTKTLDTQIQTWELIDCHGRFLSQAWKFCPQHGPQTLAQFE